MSSNPSNISLDIPKFPDPTWALGPSVLSHKTPVGPSTSLTASIVETSRAIDLGTTAPVSSATNRGGLYARGIGAGGAWLTKEQIINHIFKELGARPTRIEVRKEAKAYSNGKDRYTATFYANTGTALFVCMASRRRVVADPPAFKMSYCPHDMRNTTVEETLIDD